MPESFKNEEADKIYERYVSNLTDFASKLWLDYSPEDRQGLLVIQMQKLIDKTCVETGLTEE